MEDGEIQENALGSQGYHPSLEFPSGDGWLPTTNAYNDDPYSTAYVEDGIIDLNVSTSASSSSGAAASNLPTFRLLVLASSILPRAHTVALFDGHTEVEIGRDAPQPGSTTPRVRLKEMEVSKLHATAFWDGARREWSIVDMGSKHGTFVKSQSIGAGPEAVETQASGPSGDGAADARGKRLSPPRVSSVPRRLQHLDELSIGSTRFLVHIHNKGGPCAACSPKGGDEIPLFHDKKGKADEAARKRKRELDVASAGTIAAEVRDPRKALTMLKRSLLSRQVSVGAASEMKNAYVDRSAKRRALQPSSLDAPGTASRSISSSPAVSPAPSSRVVTPSPPVSAPATPLPSSNVGHKLLMKQGWQPGSALGVSEADTVEGSVALVEPLEAIPRSNRVGLGAPSQPASGTSSLSWKDEGKFRRWSGLNGEGG